MHYIQIYILQKLRTSAKSFTEINNDEFRTDLFSYHLKQLLTNKYITKADNGAYQLNDKGLSTISKYERENFNFRKKSDVVIILVLANIIKASKKYLFIKRKASPFSGKFGLVAGTLDEGKNISTLLEEKAKDTGGIRLHTNEFRFVMRNILYNEKDLLIDQTELVFYSKDFEVLEYKEHFWFSKEEIDDTFTYNSADIIGHIESNTQGLLQNTYNLNSLT